MNESARWITMLALLSGACGERALRSEPPALRFAHADVIEAQGGAPDLFARAERARSEALAADDPALQAEHAQRARLWLAAAVAEARRIAQARAASAAEARIAAAETQRVAFERERGELEHAALQADAAQRAHEENARAFELADRDALAGKAADRDLDPARIRAADALDARARLLLAAAVALGLTADRAAAVEAAGAPRNAPGNAFAQLARARDRLSQAEVALGEARALTPEPSVDERAALFELARARGLTAQPSPRGAVVALERAFAGNAALTSEGRRTLLAVADVLRAHPHGAVLLEVLPASGASAAEQALGQKRGARLMAALAAVAAPGRLRTAVIASSTAGAAIVLPAYASGTR